MLSQVEPHVKQIPLPLFSFLFLNGHLRSSIVLAVLASNGTPIPSAFLMIHASGLTFLRSVIRSCAREKHHHGKGQGYRASGGPALDFPVHYASKNKNGHCQI
jgi:hypothetical protein